MLEVARPRLVFLFVLALIAYSAVAAQRNRAVAPTTNTPGPITIEVDATATPAKIFRAHLVVPVTPGPLTLYYPKWIPGEHMPDGPNVDLTGLKFTAGGQTIPWTRDTLDAYTFHLQVPAGATSLEVSLDYLSPAEREGFSAGSSVSDKMAMVSWNQVLLYPKGFTATQLTYRPSLKLPAGWKFATALPGASQTGDTITFSPASLSTLVDSPVLTGEYLKAIPLTPPGQWPPQELDIGADSVAALAIPPETEQEYKNLVSEAGALFGATHFRDYHFLLSLSDHVAHFGLEHHESNDSRTDERSLIDPSLRMLMAGLLPHEYVHSWNGKYRRPADLTTPDYEQPMQDDLLWVYEGLTSYLGTVLTARSGLLTPDQSRDYLASIAARLDHEPGRTWRPLQDTANDAPILYMAPMEWSNWRRGVDFYEEGVLIWLEADTIIRQQTQGRKSLDDFCKLFHGAPSLPPGQAPAVKTYTFDDIVNTMNQVAPYDWRGFFRTRLDSTAPQAPLGGIENGGWRVVYNETESDYMRAAEAERRYINEAYSLGLVLSEKGEVLDSIFFMPAAQAGITPGMNVVAVNGRKSTAEVLHDAIKAAKGSSQPIQLLVENADYFKTYNLNYHDGEKYPHLERETSKPDLLTEIMNAHATAAAAK